MLRLHIVLVLPRFNITYIYFIFILNFNNILSHRSITYKERVVPSKTHRGWEFFSHVKLLHYAKDVFYIITLYKMYVCICILYTYYLLSHRRTPIELNYKVRRVRKKTSPKLCIAVLKCKLVWAAYKIRGYKWKGHFDWWQILGYVNILFSLLQCHTDIIYGLARYTVPRSDAIWRNLNCSLVTERFLN